MITFVENLYIRTVLAAFQTSDLVELKQDPSPSVVSNGSESMLAVRALDNCATIVEGPAAIRVFVLFMLTIS
jgi:hypothetical protein